MITVLCVRRDSIYKQLGFDCYDADRDMRTWAGGNSIVAHPPCAQWGHLKGFAKVNEAEKQLAIDCIDHIRRWGGVLEHPAASDLFKLHLPAPGSVDAFGGYSICINQSWFGHKAEKKTLLYIRGAAERELPDIPYSLDCITHVIGGPGKWNIATQRYKRPVRQSVTKAEKEHTPRSLAVWLAQVAEICDKNLNRKE